MFGRETARDADTYALVSTLNICLLSLSQDSYIENREAGVIIDENTANGAALAAVAAAAFESDFNAGNPYSVANTYSAAEMAVIMSTAPYAVNVPEPDIPGSFITPIPYPVKVSSGCVGLSAHVRLSEWWASC